MSYILCIETATEICSVALADLSGQCVNHRKLSLDNKHSSGLVPLILDILDEADITKKDLVCVALSDGPGSYTGLRVGSNTAKGMCFALNIPLITVPTLMAIAHAALSVVTDSPATILMPTIDARRMEVYRCIVNKELQIIEETDSYIYTHEGLIQLFEHYPTLHICGHGAAKLVDSFAETEWIGRVHPFECEARYLCGIAAAKYRNTEWSHLDTHTPFYYKSPNITRPKKVL